MNANMAHEKHRRQGMELKSHDPECARLTKVHVKITSNTISNAKMRNDRIVFVLMDKIEAY